MTTEIPNAPSQEQPPAPMDRRMLILGVFAMLSLCVVAAVIYFGIQAREPERAPQIAIIVPSSTPSPSRSFTPTETATISPSPRATFTPRPSATATITPTPTITPTRTPFASLTPAFPLDEDENYNLVDWIPALAQRAINILEAYPDTLSTFARREDNAGYNQAYQFAAFAERESLLRFPNAPQAEHWLYRLAFNQARINDPSACALFTQLILRKLNTGLRPEELTAWGRIQSPELLVSLFPLQQQGGFLTNMLVKISVEEHGAAYLWLLQTPNGYEAFPLTTDFDFTSVSGVGHSLADVTGDGGLEAIIYRSAKPGSFKYPLPRIFDLSQQPPVELPFAPVNPPGIGPDFRNNWEAVENPEGDATLQFNSAVFPPCPVTVQHLYTWTGQRFDFVEARYRIDPGTAILPYCATVVDHSVQVWDLQTTIQLMESLLPDWPPDQTLAGQPYPKDALDEWRFRLGIYHALIGDRQVAAGYLESVLSNPATTDSQWLTSAENFLSSYDNQADIYRACLTTEFCDPQDGLRSLIATFTSEDFSQTPSLLQEGGVTLRTSGYFDFDSDGQTDRWLVLRHHPTEKLEFWILVQKETSIAGLFAGIVESNQPGVAYVDSPGDPPIVSIETLTTLRLINPGSSTDPFLEFVEPEVIFSVDRTRQSLATIENALLGGADTGPLRDELVVIGDSPFFTCDYQNCPRFFYLLGLTNELSGAERQAVEAYLELWREFPFSPFTTLARIKLLGTAVQASATPTAIPTRTDTPTITPTITGTLPTATPTPTGTLPTGTPTQTETLAPGVTPSGTVSVFSLPGN